jgi:hypothetical protein
MQDKSEEDKAALALFGLKPEVKLLPRLSLPEAASFREGTSSSNPLSSASQSALSSELWRCIRRSAGFRGCLREGGT